MIKKLLSANRIAQRLKAIKDLLLEKLDTLNAKSEQNQHKIDQLIHQGNESSHGLRRLTDVNSQLLAEVFKTGDSLRELLENQSFLLKFSIDIVKSFQQLTQDSQFQQQAIYQSIEKIYQDSQSQQQAIYQTFQRFQQETQEYFKVTQQTLNKIHDDVHSQKYKIITDQPIFQGIEVELMCYLYSWLPFPRALDIGANQGDVTERLLQAGYEVYAFEPFLPVVEKLKTRLADCSHLHVFPLALGAVNEEKELHLVGDQNLVNDPDSEPRYPDADYTLLSSVNIHSLPEGMVFTDRVPITVTTIETLHQQGQVPTDIGLVKIDTEGFDLQVIQGMGDYRYPVVVAEFWDEKFPFGQFGADNRLPNLVEVMKQKGYHWFIVIYRIFPGNEVSFYCNTLISIDNAWGNIFFFHDYAIFSEALKWSSSVMPATYFSNAY